MTQPSLISEGELKERRFWVQFGCLCSGVSECRSRSHLCAPCKVGGAGTFTCQGQCMSPCGCGLLAAHKSGGHAFLSMDFCVCADAFSQAQAGVAEKWSVLTPSLYRAK